MTSECEKFLRAFVSWVEREPDIEGVALVGSQARGEAREESDVDLIILTSERNRLLENDEWLSRFGQVASTAREHWGNVETIRAVYSTGANSHLEIEFNIALSSWADLPLDPGTQSVVSDGFQVLFDRLGRLSVLTLKQ